MNKHTEKVLEFDLIKQKLAKYSISELGREKINNLTPLKEKQEIELQLQRTAEMAEMLGIYDLPFLGIRDVRKEIDRASLKDAYLFAEDLISVCNTLRALRVIRNYLSQDKENYPEMYTLSQDFLILK